MVDDRLVKTFPVRCQFWLCWRSESLRSAEMYWHTWQWIRSQKFATKTNYSVDSWAFREQHGTHAILSIPPLKRLKWITMTGYAIGPFTCGKEDFDLLSNKWNTGWCSIVYRHTCDILDDEHPNGYQFKVLTFSPHEKLAEITRDCSSAEFRYKSGALPARSFMWEGKVTPVPSSKSRADFDCLVCLSRSWGGAEQRILPLIPVARSDHALVLWISGERKRRHSGWNGCHSDNQCLTNENSFIEDHWREIESLGKCRIDNRSTRKGDRGFPDLFPFADERYSFNFPKI
jgi:hypothetical protein